MVAIFSWMLLLLLTWNCNKEEKMLNSYSNCVRETIAYFNERTAKKLIDTTALYFMMDFCYK